MPIRDLQMRARELGRIRMGQKGPKGQPQKLDKFRITSASRPLLEKVAELYGGKVREWDNNGVAQFEVFTEANRIPILVPPQPVTQWHEKWTAGGCKHRCDGYTNFQTGEPCDPEDPDHIEALTKPTTRLNVVLRDVEGIGVFRLESHGWNAAMELPNMAQFLAQAGGYVNGWLALHQRTSKSDGQTRQYMVPIIEIDVTPAQLLAGEGGIKPPSLEGPVAAGALEAGPGDAYTPLFDLVEGASTLDELGAIWDKAVTDKLVGKASTASERRVEFDAAFKAKAEQIKHGGQPDQDGAYPAEVLDPAELWQACVNRAGELGMSLWEVEKDLRDAHGVDVPDASVEVLQTYLEDLRTRDAA